MTNILPFRPYRPTPELAGKVAAPPYDVVTADEARALTRRNRHSFLHVTRAEVDLPPDTDPYDAQVYQQAKARLALMIAAGTLVRAPEAQFYIYKQIMRRREQVGLVACAAIDDYLNGVIKVHELTRSDKEADRVRHADICDAHTGLVFLTYRENTRITDIITAWMRNHAPINDFMTSDRIHHAVWGIDEQAVIAELASLFREIPALYIADGHHRAAAAVKIGQARRAQSPNFTGSEPFNFFPAILVPDSETQINAYHRIVHGLHGLSPQEFLDKARTMFEITPSPGNKAYSPKKPHQFGVYLANVWHIFRAKPESYDAADAIGRLDVSILQEHLLAPILGIAEPRHDQRISFVGGVRQTRDLEQYATDAETVVFALSPTQLADVMAVADAGKIMPPKSTWFEPKPRCGLFVHVLSEETSH